MAGGGFAVLAEVHRIWTGREDTDHSTISRTRRLFWLSTHKAIFSWALKVVAEEGLLSGKTVGVDATTLEANAAMRSIVRRDSGQGYDEYVKQLARAAGLENPTPEQQARFDRKRKKKTSNRDWMHPHDPDARVTRMKDGRTHLAHKAEHAVDLETGAVVAITLQAADLGDTTTIVETLREAQRSVKSVGKTVTEVVTDKGYHSVDVLKQLHEQGIRTYIAEPDRGKQKWKGKEVEQRCVYANRRRLRGKRGKQLQRKRGELVERPFAHTYDTGGMRRVHLRGRRNILKRVLVQGAGVNLALVMRSRVRRRQTTAGSRAETRRQRPHIDALVASPRTHRRVRCPLPFVGRSVGINVCSSPQ